MAWHFYFAPFAAQYTLRIEEKGTALNAHKFASVHGFFADHVESRADLALFVRQEVKWEFVLGFEFLVGRNGVRRNADNLNSRLPKFGVQIAKGLTFAGAASGVVARIEVDHQFGSESILRAECFSAS